MECICIKAIAEVCAAEFVKRIQLGHKTRRLSSIRADVENPHKKGRRTRELCRIDDEADAALRAKKYLADVKKTPLIRQEPLKRITDRLNKPHLQGLTRSKLETLARAIQREGPGIPKSLLDPDTYYGLVLEGVHVLFPDDSYMKKGDTVVHKEIMEDVDGRPFELQLVTKRPSWTLAKYTGSRSRTRTFGLLRPWVR